MVPAGQVSPATSQLAQWNNWHLLDVTKLDHETLGESPVYLPDDMWCLSRVIHFIISLWLNHPFSHILITKYNYTNAYQQMAHNA